MTKQIATIKWTDKNGQQGSKILESPFLTQNYETNFFCLVNGFTRKKQVECGTENVTCEISYQDI